MPNPPPGQATARNALILALGAAGALAAACGSDALAAVLIAAALALHVADLRRRGPR